jgi:hypothetical protein
MTGADSSGLRFRTRPFESSVSGSPATLHDEDIVEELAQHLAQRSTNM